ncbi:hypothetical protein ACPPVO_36610 [Dactylosporangium sp. McL0621]|uniref:hypothetical protein n=1 Tax=Dactylosporangium sp. McL0621 TaxID=3415678 RepID=UPI003CE87148
MSIPRRLFVSTAVVLALTTAGVLVVELTRPAPTPASAPARPSALPAGPGEPPQTATAPDGTQIFCPSGAVPAITVNEATFAPTLQGGQSFAAGRYQIKLRGLVLNETTASIAVETYTVTIAGAAWPATVHAPDTVAAGTAGEITVDGTYDSTGPAPADLHVAMHWVWSVTSLRPCGPRGLIEDD